MSLSPPPRYTSAHLCKEKYHDLRLEARAYAKVKLETSHALLFLECRGLVCGEPGLVQSGSKEGCRLCLLLHIVHHVIELANEISDVFI